MNLPLRFGSAAVTVTIFLILLCLITPAIAAADTGTTAPVVMIPTNNPSLTSISACCTITPQSSFEKFCKQEITLLRLESNLTTFPGPRSMAFGPRYIQLTTNIGALLIILIGACIVVTVFVIYRRTKTVADEDTEDVIENIQANGGEKQV